MILSESKVDEIVEVFGASQDGTDHLKSLIFNLATAGKLVPQIPDEKHALEVMELVKGGEVLHETIPGWLNLKLSLCAEIYNGNSTNAAEKALMEKNQSGLEYIATKDVGYGFQSIEYDTGLRIGTEKNSFKIAPAHSILICLEGGSAGKKMGLLFKEVAFGNKLFAVVCKDWILPRFLLMYFLSSKFQNDFRQKMTGIIGGISKSNFINIQIPIPPLAEQNRIVRETERFIAICDALEKARIDQHLLSELFRNSSIDAISTAQSPEELQIAWERIQHNWEVIVGSPEAIDLLKTLILDLAVRGDLISISHSRAAEVIKWTSSELKLDESKLWSLPTLHEQKRAGWNRIPLAKLGSWGSGGTPTSSRKDYYQNGTIPWAVIGDMNNDIMTSTEARITEKALLESSSKLVPVGAVLIAMYGASIGKTAITGIECCTNQAIAHCIIDTNIVSKEYFFIVAKSLKRHLIQEGKGAAQPNISQSVLKHLVIDLPSLDEQKKIVERVEALMQMCDHLKHSLRNSEDLAEKFSRSVVSASA